MQMQRVTASRVSFRGPAYIRVPSSVFLSPGAWGLQEQENFYRCVYFGTRYPSPHCLRSSDIHLCLTTLP